MDKSEEKRRAAIGYILRRRKRGRKLKASSGEIVKSWAEYSEVNFKPTASALPFGRYILIFLGLAIPFTLFAIVNIEVGAFNRVDSNTTPLEWTLILVCGLCLLIIAIMTFIVLITAFWRIIQANWFRHE